MALRWVGGWIAEAGLVVRERDAEEMLWIACCVSNFRKEGSVFCSEFRQRSVTTVSIHAERYHPVTAAWRQDGAQGWGVWR